MKITFSSDVNLFCSVCGEPTEIEEAVNGFGQRKDTFIVKPCKTCIPKVAKVKELLDSLHHLAGDPIKRVDL